MRLHPKIKAILKRPKHIMRTGLIFAALVLLFCDIIAALWPAFAALWSNKVAHVGVGIASIAAVLVETVHEEEEERHED